MAGAMRKMAVYLGLVEDDGYDGRGFDPDDDFEPELDPEPERDHRRHEPSHQSHGAHGAHQLQRGEEVRVAPSPRFASRSPGPLRFPLNRHARRASRPWHPSHKNAPAWRRTHR